MGAWGCGVERRHIETSVFDVAGLVKKAEAIGEAFDSVF